MVLSKLKAYLVYVSGNANYYYPGLFVVVSKYVMVFMKKINRLSTLLITLYLISVLITAMIHRITTAVGLKV